LHLFADTYNGDRQNIAINGKPERKSSFGIAIDCKNALIGVSFYINGCKKATTAILNYRESYMKQVIEAHQNEYECTPEVIAVSPGRFHLAGEHSWFFKDKTLSMAVDLPVYIAVSKRSDNSLRFFFSQVNERKKANLSSLKYKREDKWANAIKAIVYAFEAIGIKTTGLNVTVYSQILPSAGFGITTAIKIATAIALRSVFALDEKKYGNNFILRAVEIGNRQFLNVGNYLADNFAALFSKKDSLLITDHAKMSYEIIPFSFPKKTIILTDARVPRISVWNEESLRQAENALLLGELKQVKSNVFGGWVYEESKTEINEVLSVVNEDTRRRLFCIMKEHQCVLDAVSGLKKNDFSAFAKSINESHVLMRDLYEASCPEIDWIYKRVLEFALIPDVHQHSACCRITGKGFGRCAYTILDNEQVDNFKKKLSEYERIFGFKAITYTVQSAEGAHIL